MSDNYSPIFIVGTPRSGTTLTANILGRHTRIFMSGENHFFEDIYANRSKLGIFVSNANTKQKIFCRLRTLYERYNQIEDQQRTEKLISSLDIESIFGSWNSYKDVLSWVMELQAHEVSKPRWGNNTPKDIFHIEEILEFYPNAKILICIRRIPISQPEVRTRVLSLIMR